MWRGERLLAFLKKVGCDGRRPLALLEAGIEIIIKTVVQHNSSSLLFFSNAACMGNSRGKQFCNGTELKVRVCRDTAECSAVVWHRPTSGWRQGGL